MILFFLNVIFDDFFWGGASPGSAGCFKKPTQIPNAGHPIYGLLSSNYNNPKVI
jgi:hypothetical protein